MFRDTAAAPHPSIKVAFPSRSIRPPACHLDWRTETKAMRNANNAKWMGKAQQVLAVVVLAAVQAAAQQKTAQRPQRQVLVSIPDRKLAVLENNQVLKVYRVSVGKRSTPSPSGEFKIINRLSYPTYYHKGTVIPPGPDNPLGSRWIGLDLKGYGIHGTNAPKSVGKPMSHGCIRMAKADLEEAFELLRVGDRVVIQGEADEESARVFGAASV